MHIVIIHNSKIPALKYGGIERVIWYLGEELAKRGHVITYLVKAGSSCTFANVISINSNQSINQQIPKDADFVHVHFQPEDEIEFPHLITIHGNLPKDTVFYKNTSFVSENHAKRYGANAFAYNGMNWDDYGKPILTASKKLCSFFRKSGVAFKKCPRCHKNCTCQ
jgi:hypothetical protein